MALERKTVPVIFEGGLDQKTNSQLVVPGKFLALENVIRRKNGQIQKRNGYTALGTGVATASDQALRTPYYALRSDGETLNLIHQRGVATYSESDTSWSGTEHNSSMVPLQASTRSLYASIETNGLGNIKYNTTCAIIDNYQATVWNDGNYYTIVVKDLSSNRVVYTATSSYSGTFPFTDLSNIVAMGSKFVFYVRSSSTDRERIVFDSATLALSTTSETFSGTVSNIILRKYSSSEIAEAILNGTDLVIRIRNASGVVSSVVLATTVDELYDIAVNATTGYIYTAYRVGNDKLIKAYNPSSGFLSSVLTVVSDAYAYHIKLGSTSDATLYYAYNIDLVRGTYSYFTATWNGGSGTSAGTLGSVYFLSRAILPTSTVLIKSGIGLLFGYAPGYGPDLIQRTCLISLSLTGTYSGGVGGDQLVGKFFESETYTSHSVMFIYTPSGEIVEHTSGVYRFVTPYITKYSGVDASGTYNDLETGVGEIILDTTVNINIPTAVIDSGICIGNTGILQKTAYTVMEMNCRAIPSISLATGTVGSLVNGVYSVIAVYEWEDHLGQIHRSAPSIAKSITLAGANDSISVTVTRPSFIRSSSPSVKIRLYYTEANGTLYYAATSASYVSDIQTEITISITDAPTLTQAFLYTTGGVLENLALENVTYLKYFKGRIFALLDGIDGAYCYSKEKVPGEPFSFNPDVLVDTTEQPQGRFTALAELDEKLILFQRNSIKYIAGDGPDDTGNNNDYPLPLGLPAAVGCSEPASVVETPLGVFFKSLKGIYLLSRSLETVYVGAPVEDFNSYEITSAVHMESTEEVRFTTRTGPILVYNYTFNTWSTFPSITCQDATVWDGNYTYLTTGNEIRVESAAWSDNGSAIQMSIETGWLALTGIQGYQRVHDINILGKFLSSATLTIDLYYDFDDTTIVETVSKAYAAGPDVQLRIRPKVQKCTAVKMRIRESSTGAGFQLTGIQLDVGIKAGTSRLSAGETV